MFFLRIQETELFLYGTEAAVKQQKGIDTALGQAVSMKNDSFPVVYLPEIRGDGTAMDQQPVRPLRRILTS